jgi:hypothetical protein
MGQSPQHYHHSAHGHCYYLWGDIVHVGPTPSLPKREGTENGKLSSAFHRQKAVTSMSEVNLRRRSSTSACRETEYKVEQSLTITEEREELKL